MLYFCYAITRPQSDVDTLKEHLMIFQVTYFTVTCLMDENRKYARAEAIESHVTGPLPLILHFWSKILKRKLSNLYMD